MPNYAISPAGADDLLQIALYTIKTWGLEQTDRYEAALESHFRAIGRGEAVTSNPIPHRPDLRCSRCEHHYVFSLHRPGTVPLILAVLHENMDLMKRLAERL
ncbi:MAG: type II toxin-antitoxin system RelE/ParE family toxin [Planctomycetes bacterium]|nr:type II toxin-antitoxin system RelE/ParE family toxin [Planctomycetota bacterium]